MSSATVARHTEILYVSHRLQVLRLPDSPAWGQWVQLPDLSPDWFRRLDAETAAWLSGSLSAALRNGSLGDRASEAKSMLEGILEAGRAAGQLSHGPLPQSTGGSWYADCPRDLVDCHTAEDFPPGPPRNSRQPKISNTQPLQSATNHARDFAW
jgi:hypothetical protein